MKRFKPGALILLSAITLIGLSGCDQVEQTVNKAMEETKQSASQAIDEAKQSISTLLEQTEEGEQQNPSVKDDDGNEQADKATEQSGEVKDQDD